MALVSGSPKATAPKSAKVTDWVERQALEDRRPDAADANGTEEPGFKPSLAANPGYKRYDIETLLKLGYTRHLADTPLRIHPASLQEQIFKPVPCVPYSRAQKRSRGLSDVSLNSLHSIASDEEVIYRKSRPTRMPFAPPQSFHDSLRLGFVNRFPKRQPHSPPANSLAQHHDGFARFLKEHASPPHQRVTAGGRIVPAGGPPPVFNVDSLRASSTNPAGPEASVTPQKVRKGQVVGNNAREAFSATSKITPANAYGSGATENMISSQYRHPSLAVHVVNSNMVSSNGQAPLQIYPGPQMSVEGIPMILPDGSNIVVQNGMTYRVYWNGFTTVSEPYLFPPSTIPEPTSFAPQYSIANPYVDSSNVPLISGDVTNARGAGVLQTQHQVPDHVLERAQESLRYELKKLDKHIALRSQTFSAFEHANFVAQRKRLVEQMDNIRISRGGRGERSSSSSRATDPGNVRTSLQAPSQGQHAIYQARTQNRSTSQGDKSIRQPYQPGARGVSGGPPWDELVNGTMKDAPTTKPVIEPQQKTPPAKKGLGASSVLSPDAPPFIPSGMQGNSVRKVETCLPYISNEGGSVPNVAGSSSVSAPALDYGQPYVGNKKQEGAPAFTPNSDHQVKQLGVTAKDYNMKSGRSTSGSAMADIVPLVHWADIAYVENLGLNPVHEPKLHCSTITEFQEVIRRVREQARLYGCEGGQSKDPEFDAEQDIRWAMADSSPIPLPKKMPDHIAYPRPWNWNDSAFNIRADRSHLKSRKPGSPSSQVPKGEARVRISDMGISSESYLRDQQVRADNAQGDNSVVTFNTPGAARAILGERSLNTQAAATCTTELPSNSAVLQSKPICGKGGPDENLARQDSLVRYNAQKKVEKTAPSWSKADVITEVVGSVRHLPYQASMKDDNENLNPPAALSLTSVRMGLDRQKSTNSNTEAGTSEKPINTWTKEDQAALDAAYGDPFKRAPSPDGWGDIPVPPETLSKAPFGLENFQKGPSRDPCVHVPNAQHYESPKRGALITKANTTMISKPLGYNEHTPVSIPTRLTSTSSSSFLRGMLKQQVSSGAAPSRQVSFGEGPRRPSDKENLRSSTRYGSSAEHVSDHPVGKGNQYFSNQDPRRNKAQSSIAPSAQYARGYLPQYPAANSTQSSAYYTRAHPFQAYSGVHKAYPGSLKNGPVAYLPRPGLPQYDGGADSPPQQSKTPSDKAEQAESQKGANLTPQAFQQEDDKLPAGHSYAVDRLFQTIRDAERKEMSGQDPKESKSTN